jgi:hypothetical protein
MRKDLGLTTISIGRIVRRTLAQIGTEAFQVCLDDCRVDNTGSAEYVGTGLTFARSVPFPQIHDSTIINTNLELEAPWFAQTVF